MKKSILLTIVLTILATVLVAFTGCANSKLVATRTDEDGKDKCETKIEITFKKKVAYEVKTTMKFNNKDAANEAAEYFKDQEGFKQKGKTIIIKQKADTYFKGIDKDKLTRDYLKDLLEKAEYKVK